MFVRLNFQPLIFATTFCLCGAL